MRIALGQPLIAALQSHNIYSEDYNRIADAVYNSLGIIEQGLAVDDCVMLPNGTTLQVTYKIKEG